MKIDPEFQALIPPLSSEEYALLEASLKAEGCRDPLVVWGEILVDGHHRHAICVEHKITYKTVQHRFDSREAAMDWIDANQLGRRNLPPDAASVLRGRRYNRTKKSHGGDRRSSTQSEYLKERTVKTLADTHGVSQATIQRDGKRAAFVATLPKATQRDILSGKTKIAKVVQERHKAAVDARLKTVEIPSGRYRVIYADPPWQYATPQHSKTEQDTVLASHYPSLSMDELCALPIRDLAASNAVLFLWVTSPLLLQSARIIEAWGFDYKASFVWDKVKHNVGHYVSVRHELLLIATRGSCLPDSARLLDSVVSIERTGHSVKPPVFRDMIDQMYTPHPHDRIELFARGELPSHWDRWGNE